MFAKAIMDQFFNVDEDYNGGCTIGFFCRNTVRNGKERKQYGSFQLDALPRDISVRGILSHLDRMGEESVDVTWPKVFADEGEMFTVKVADRAIPAVELSKKLRAIFIRAGAAVEA